MIGDTIDEIYTRFYCRMLYRLIVRAYAAYVWYMPALLANPEGNSVALYAKQCAERYRRRYYV